MFLLLFIYCQFTSLSTINYSKMGHIICLFSQSDPCWHVSEVFFLQTSEQEWADEAPQSILTIHLDPLLVFITI